MNLGPAEIAALLPFEVRFKLRRRRWLDGYHDEAVGVLAKDAAGRLAITKVTLRPQVRFSGEKVPNPEELRRLHDQAHHACFIANSVKTEVVVEPQ